MLIWNSWRALSLLLILSLLVTLTVSQVSADDSSAMLEDFEEAVVVDVIDGDTLDVELVSGRRIERIRLIGIDTPETNNSYDNQPECYGVESSQYSASILEEGETVWLEQDVDPEDDYDRLLRYVWFISGEDGELYLLNLVMVDGGFAESRHYEPNTTRQDDLDDAEEDAVDDGRGLWAGCDQSLNPNDEPEFGLIPTSSVGMVVDGAVTEQETSGDLATATTTTADTSEEYACSFFANRRDAQEFMNAYPEMRTDLDPDGNGIACESYRQFS